MYYIEVSERILKLKRTKSSETVKNLRLSDSVAGVQGAAKHELRVLH